MKQKIEIHTAEIKDIPTIVRLAEAIWIPTYKAILSAEQVNYMFQKTYHPDALLQQMEFLKQCFLLIYSEGTAKGFASFTKIEEEEGLYKLNKLYVLSTEQGKGFGRSLLKEVEVRAAEEGGDIMELNVNRYNKAIEFYKAMDYTIYKEEDIPIGPYFMNDYIMRKTLI